MAYATLGEVQVRVSLAMLQDVADDNSDGAFDTGVVLAALDSASSLADGYIAAYLPLPSVPHALRDAVIDIAMQSIRLPRDKGTEDSEKAYKAAMAWLKDVQDGTALLFPKPSDGIVDPGDPDIVSESRQWTMRAASRVF